MVIEIAEIEVQELRESEFERTFADTAKLLQEAEGCSGVRLLRGVERPAHYRLLIDWESVEHHARFRETAEFSTWRAHVGPFFASTPSVEHVQDVLDS